MKVNEQNAVNTSKPQSIRLYDTPRPAGASPPSAGRVQNTGDDIDLNSQADLLSQAQSAGSSDRSANVERLRALVQSGQYRVDHAALSNSIIDSAISGF